ncbi:Type I restriction enzyme StySPI M protein [Agrobacterium tumefaciens str. CFBP 5621]|uniref:class I SAM-dependent DNA methyltransferase n=1 Tax=Agrobacterium tumefaciens TaxID=358 RepID=UPI0009BB5FE4|nr:N-6 DNA methylase [Agrobacterium tumefaciens]CUX50648.1 Type I restriction enzyme StySPI M protein [Agrobacterium tumefaciens str. CFBP 5621]
MNANAIVQKLWRLCTVLRKDGITYQQYVTELTYLLFLKMMGERNRETGSLPKGMRWADLMAKNPFDRLGHYRQVLLTLGTANARLGEDDVLLLPLDGNASLEERKRYADARPLPEMVQKIFDNASTFLREPQNLTTLVTAIDELDWFSEERDQFGDLYEGLLQKNAEETKRGAGQYFTPRVLIELLVRLMQPRPGEVIQDPAAGTGGFVIAADRYMKARTDDYLDLGEKEQEFQKRRAIHGMENVPGTLRLLLMNLYLHDIDGDHVDLGDTLSDKGKGLGRADLILTNPPFGPAGGAPTRDDLSVTANVSSYQLPFVEHCIRALQPGGRAAIVVPDNVLFEDGRGRELRRMMMDWCDLHTILRLPTGIFYAQGVKTNVIFLTRAKTESGNTKSVWIYDLRAQMPKFGKTTPLTEAHFEGFEQAFGKDPYGKERGPDEGEAGRWRQFTREAIAARGDNLDIAWLREAEEEAEEGLIEPDDIAAAILGHLQAATLEIEALMAELGDGLPEAAE